MLGKGGMVALLGEVGEMDVLEVGVSDIGEELGALVVGEVALAAEDALFIDRGAAGGVNHGGLVVGFDVEVIALFEVAFNEGGGKAKVGAKTYFEEACTESESDGI